MERRTILALAAEVIRRMISVKTKGNNRSADMEIKRIGSQSSGKGPAEWFTGTVRIDPLFQAPDPALVQGASVTFEPGARTHWHTHPGGQALLILAGRARVGAAGQPAREAAPGDVVYSPPGEWHWHGAGPDGYMVHVATNPGGKTEWGEDREVSAGEYVPGA